MQLLESNERTKWFVWRKWGRVGTHMGSSQKNEFKKLEAAIKYFEKIYLSKTQNKFGSPTFEKQPGKYYPIEVAHDVDKNADLRKLAGSGVELQTSLITDKFPSGIFSVSISSSNRVFSILSMLKINSIRF